MKHFDDETEKGDCLKKSMNFFKFQKTVAEKTLQQLETLKKE